MAVSDQERRGAHRVPVFDICEVDRPEDRIRVELLDASRGGLRVAASRPLDAHSVMLVHTPFHPLGVPLRAVVVRTWETGPGRWEAGLEFLRLEADEQALLDVWLDGLEER
jgi:hypothetical protein